MKNKKKILSIVVVVILVMFVGAYAISLDKISDRSSLPGAVGYGYGYDDDFRGGRTGSRVDELYELQEREKREKLPTVGVCIDDGSFEINIFGFTIFQKKIWGKCDPVEFDPNVKIVPAKVVR
ncbi:MAG: hypothetical protein ACI9GH_000190 [Candidatus Paceibacteria bacterium]|jgi:hypothetical protein